MGRRFSLCLMSLLAALPARAADSPPEEAARRRRAAIEFHHRALERTGILIPLYVDPAGIDTNPAYVRLVELKRRFQTVPVWIIVNPDSGPGDAVDERYVDAVDRLCGGGCVLLGYVATGYGDRPEGEVEREIARWREFYPRVHGIFLDEAPSEDTAAAVARLADRADYARGAGFWPIVANPGTDTPRRYFESATADVFVVHESDSWPAEEQLNAVDRAAYADFPPFTRAMLVHSQPRLDLRSLRDARRRVRWIYVTDDRFRSGDPDADNPWDSLSAHIETLFETLADD